MKLTGMATALSAQMKQPGTYEVLSFKERLTLLVISRESLERDQRKHKRLLQKARLKPEASVHDLPACQKPGAFTYHASEPERMGTHGPEPAVTGPCGYGKSYVGCALGNNACQQGYSVKYWRLGRLLGELTHMVGQMAATENC